MSWFNKNIIWENKSIILGIIFHLTKNRSKLEDSRIIIDNDLFKNITKILFPDLLIKRKVKNQNEDQQIFHINIRNNKKKDLIINNINNLDTIHNKKIRLLPWYDKDNPMIMFIHKNGKDFGITKKKSKLKEFSKYRRFLPHNSGNYVSMSCNNVNIWDTYIEYKILNKYSKVYGVPTDRAYNFISKVMKEHICDKKDLMYIGVPIKEYIKVPVPIAIKVPIEKKPKTYVLKKDNCDKYKNVIRAVDNKVEAINKIVDSNK